MLGKLIKHDFRALSRTLFPLQIGILAGGLIATLLTVVTIRIADANAAAANGTALLQGVIMVVSVITSALIAIAIAASAFITLLLICLHFYNSFLCDEGYLTFTLPVSTGELLWSKLITGMLWMLINMAVIAVTIVIFAFFGTTTEGVISAPMIELTRELFSRLLPAAQQHVNVPLLLVVAIVAGLLGLAAQLLEIYFAIIVGGQVAKKHRILASIGMYLLINMGVGIITSVLSAILMFGEGVWSIALNTFSDVSNLSYAALGWGSLISLGLCVLFFLTSRSILKKNLNLQ